MKSFDKPKEAKTQLKASSSEKSRFDVSISHQQHQAEIKEKKLLETKESLKLEDINKFQENISSISKNIKWIDKEITTVHGKNILNLFSDTNWEDFKDTFKKNFEDAKKTLDDFISSKSIKSTKFLTTKFSNISNDISITNDKTKLIKSYILSSRKIRSIAKSIDNDLPAVIEKLGSSEFSSRIGMTRGQIENKVHYASQSFKSIVSINNLGDREFAVKEFVRYTDELSKISQKISQQRHLEENG